MFFYFFLEDFTAEGCHSAESDFLFLLTTGGLDVEPLDFLAGDEDFLLSCDWVVFERSPFIEVKSEGGSEGFGKIYPLAMASGTLPDKAKDF